MQRQLQRHSSRASLAHRGLAATLAVLLLCVYALVALPHLHEEMHEDAHHAEHECVITLFVHAAVDVTATATTVQLPVVRAYTLPLVNSVICPVFAAAYAPSRAPPL